MSTPEQRLEELVAETFRSMPGASHGELSAMLAKRVLDRRETDPLLAEIVLTRGITAAVEWELPILAAEDRLRKMIRGLFESDLPVDEEDAQRIVQQSVPAFLKGDDETCLCLAYRRMEQIVEEEFEGLGIVPHPSLLANKS